MGQVRPSDEDGAGLEPPEAAGDAHLDGPSAHTPSLRVRLFAIILIPLLLVACAIGFWRLGEARTTAGQLQDRTLMFTALAVARDVSLGEGDIISGETQRLLTQAAGSALRYHVYAPDGAYVIGYAVPPIPISRSLPPERTFAYYDARDRGNTVRVLRLRQESLFDGLVGTFTITVWQDQSVRARFVQALALRAFALIAALVGAVALLLWFGVSLGLKPLTDLEDAISIRNPGDLNPIRRPVPIEAQGLVLRLNGLFGQVSETLAAQADFISNAAHQLRNPLAGVRALGEAIETAPSLPVAQSRARDLVAAADQAVHLAERLLTLERETGGPPTTQSVDLAEIAKVALLDIAAEADARGVARHVTLSQAPVRGDSLMLGEALLNLLRNALAHGGPDLSRIDVTLDIGREHTQLTITDDGQGVPPEALPRIKARFEQARPGQGSGLGLSIADAVAIRCGGRLDLAAPGRGLQVTLTLPNAPASTSAPPEAPR